MESCKLVDSGKREQYGSGAIRENETGKGRFDLLQLREISTLYYNCSDTFMGRMLELFDGATRDKELTEGLYTALGMFCKENNWTVDQLTVGVAHQMEDGAAKYFDRNWEKGMPIHRYFDSALRHLFKWRAGMTDEPHDRAFCWNVLCILYSVENLPEWNDLPYTNIRFDKDGNRIEVNN